MPDIPKILLLGDSIRCHYQPHVANLLNGKAQVVGPSENHQTTLYTLSSLDRWIKALGNPDVIHWNNGIWDSGHNPSRSPVQIPIDMYRANLGLILKRLKALTPKVIWATTTPVHPDRPFLETAWSWRNGEISQYNGVARELMVSDGVPINDLHTLVWDNLCAFLSQDQLHLSEAGQKACAQAVSECVLACLPVW